FENFLTDTSNEVPTQFTLHRLLSNCQDELNFEELMDLNQL
ncbi:unnamed protein product, partial [Didymodactylos carnosus]